MRHWVFLLMLAFLSGCVMKGSHYNALVELRDNASIDFSRQVLNAVVGVRDQAELPSFFYIEGGQSNWGTNFSASANAQFQLPFAGERTIFSPAGNAGENWGLAMQINDFGPSSMSRVSAMFVFLCYPITIGGGELPNGALFTAVEKFDSKAPFLMHVKSEDGYYYGVTKKTQLEFFKLSRDITYWSRHLNPDPFDLESITGRLYAFFSQYPQTEVQLAEAVLSASKAVQDFEGSMQDYSNHLEKVQELEQKAVSGEYSHEPKVFQTVLEHTYEQQRFKFEMLGGANNAKKQTQQTLSSLEQKINALVNDLEATVLLIKHADPQSEQIDLAAIVEPFNQRISGILAHDGQVLKKVLYQVPSSVSVEAEDSIDKLYRERFEALPLRFNDAALQIQ